MKYSMGVFFIIVLITLLTTIIAVFPAGIFWLAFKASSLISEKRYIPAVAIIIFTSLALIFFAMSFYYIVLVVLVASFILILLPIVYIFNICVPILLLLSIHLVDDIFYKKKLSNVKRVAIGVLIAIYFSEIAGIIYFFVFLASRK